MANSFGHGKTELSFYQLETKTPNFSIKTIQPLTALTDSSSQLTFVQAQISSGENHGERRATINLGVGQRYLLEDGQSIAGINLFTDYETESGHRRASFGLEYKRANFNINVNKYYPLSNKVVIGDYTEEPLAGHDIKLTGQVPYLPWARIKGTQYYWDAITGDDIKGTRLGIEVDVNASTTLEVGTENANTAGRSGYARLRVQLPYNANTASTHFVIADMAFENSTRLSLAPLKYVERSNKIRIEKRLNGVSVVLGVYNATTLGATCTLYNSLGVAITNSASTTSLGVTGSDGKITLSNILLPTTNGLIYASCTGGTYIDEATGITTNAPTIRSGAIYSGTGNFILTLSPLSEIAYQLADTASGDLDAIAAVITAKNTAVATAFGLSGVDINTTTPTDLNTTTAANDDAGKFGLLLATISQMGENSDDATPTATITALVTDMNDGDIDGRATGTETVTIAQAINNFINSNGDNNTTNGAGAGNTGTAGSATGEDSIKGDLAIYLISNYDGTDTAPTLQNYIDAGITTGVTAGNLAEVNSQIASATIANSDSTAEIQSIVDSAPSVMNIDDQTRSIAENSASETSVGAVLVTSGTPTGFNITSGNTNTAFAISGAGQITVADVSELDFETTPSYTLTVQITKTDATSQSANITITVTNVFESETLSFSGVTYATVISPDTGEIWLDRNLGAAQVATSITDSNSYGDLYQWGRPADGHQLINPLSTITDTRASSLTPAHDNFITFGNPPFFPGTEWTVDGVDDDGSLRSAFLANTDGSGICPAGYRVPTEAELTADSASATDFNGFLKLPTVGNRYSANPTLGFSGHYWSSSPSADSRARSLNLGIFGASFDNTLRAFGCSVRCIKD